MDCKKLLVAFGKSNKRSWMPIHTLFEKLGKEKSRALLFFHAFSGCDNRRTLFTEKNRPYDKIPPTRAALFQHVQDYHIQINGAGKKEKMRHCMYTGLTITQSLMFAML